MIRYFQKVASEYEIVDKFHLNTDVSELRWLESEKMWEATLRYMAPGTGDLSKIDREKLIQEKGEQAVYVSSEKIRAKVAISCVGGLVEPRSYPEGVTGWDNFKGDLCHTARWNEKDFTGKDVVVVGTGCSAAQTVPRLTHPPYNARSVTQIMRTPPWVLPKVSEPGGKEWYSKNAAWWFENVPGLHLLLRSYIAYAAESEWFRYYGNSKASANNRTALRKVGLDYMHKKVPERYWKMLTPTYDVCCKRRIFDKEWYMGFNEDNIYLTNKKLLSIGENSVTLGAGGEFPDLKDASASKSEMTIPADSIILANGFDATKWLHPMNVVGKEGRGLHEVWAERGGPQAYMGAAMDGFPNFFIVFGPNTATGHTSVILASENMANYAAKFVRKILEGDATTVEVKKEAEIEWTTRIQRELKRSVFHIGGCVSWYVDRETGWNSSVYSRTQIDHTLRCMFPNWSDWTIELTRKGLIKKRVWQLLRLVFTASAIVGMYRLRRSGIKLRNLPAVAKMSAKMSLMALLGQVSAGAESLQEKLF